MARILDYVIGRTVFHDPAEVHDRDVIGDIAGQGDIVADEHHRRVLLFRQIDQHIDDIRADGNVQHGDRFVRDDEARFQEHRTDDGDTLQLATGQFVRISLDEVIRRSQAVRFQGVQAHLQALFVIRADIMVFQRPHQDLFDRITRGERIKGVLEDDLYHTAESLRIAFDDVLRRFTIDETIAARRFLQAGQHLGQGRFPAAGFTDDAQDLAVIDGQVDTVQGFDEVLTAAETSGLGSLITGAEGIPFRDIFDLDIVFTHCRSLLPHRAGRRSCARPPSAAASAGPSCSAPWHRGSAARNCSLPV